MINYNPKEWFTFIFRLHKADTVRKLTPMFFYLGLYAAAVAFLELNVFQLSKTHSEHLKNISLMHGLLGFVISLLLVFRTNTAYDRWWEGRRQWGTLVNVSRSLAIKLQAILPEGHPARAYFRTMIPNFAFSMKQHLRNQYHPGELELDEPHELSQEKHMPNQISAHMMRKVIALHQEGLLTGEQLIFMNEELRSFTDVCGACERIKNTPIPFSYSVFLKKFIFFYVMTLPLGYVFSVGYIIIPMIVFIFYVLASLELIAEEIEDPFGTDANDLPADTICNNIRLHVQQVL
ncbi:bestrophin family protein [Chitinophaga sedimenti]|uniref:bestrophin family protein n=1 Tax=Chitinophaga sedimenti TaxID=2033606 RepID=UPI002005D29F|nr:bestrophin family protein [Chitinophaga sedimenti]MCK7556869.1 bestrophin family protein [Chitinophaga sedimenti]